MNYQDIVARIKKGESVDSIADEMAAMLNDAQKAVAEENVAAAKEAEKNAKMDEVATKIADALSEYMIMMGFEAEESLTGTEVREMLDEFMPLFNKLKNFKVKIETIPPSHAEDLISKWLKNMYW